MLRFKTQINEIVGKPPMMNHVSYISRLNLMLVFVGLKHQFLMEIVEKTIHYYSGFREKSIFTACKIEIFNGNADRVREEGT